MFENVNQNENVNIYFNVSICISGSAQRFGFSYGQTSHIDVSNATIITFNQVSIECLLKT